MATSASLSSFTGSIVAETPRECVVMILPAVMWESDPYIDRCHDPFHQVCGGPSLSSAFE
jgi:hypothetical protein